MSTALPNLLVVLAIAIPLFFFFSNSIPFISMGANLGVLLVALAIYIRLGARR